ncbi:SagB family peptide dehydrogenase [Brevibacillus sp. NRS-1366]|uniref:SagB family peptide dehydrogenase n=1 Tax=Brevibacillus sp. NRS-1366 TaxID=3233899 RepID=UPI003D24A4E5
MSLEAFIHHLHFDTDKVRPPDLDVDWEDAPLPYKLYRGLPVYPLPSDIPLTLRNYKVQSNQHEPSLSQVGAMLWYTFGVTQVSQTVIPVSSEDDEMLPLQSNRRFLPSGGALYPSELYLYLKLSTLTQGIYHYDVAHHRLVLLREGNFDDYLTRALGDDCHVTACFGAAFVTTYFWKNFYKYHYFSYRLQGLDAGVLLGQWLGATACLGISASIKFQYVDRAINHLIGIAEQEENTYAVIPLSLQPGSAWGSKEEQSLEQRQSHMTAEQLTSEIPKISPSHFVRSKRVKDYPLLQRMNEASMIESTRSFIHSAIDTKAKRWQEPGTCSGIALPVEENSDSDFAEYCRKRFSPDTDFVMKKVSLTQVSRLLYEGIGAFFFRHDLGTRRDEIKLDLYVCLNHVDGIPDGAYRYEPINHELLPIQYGDHRLRLQAGMTLENVNLHQVPLCFHVVGTRDHLAHKWGHRGYRIQQMGAGMFVQRLLMTAFTCGMGGHPLLGYDVRHCDEIYQIEKEGKTCLIQIPVGHYRPRTRLQGGLHG